MGGGVAEGGGGSSSVGRCQAVSLVRWLWKYVRPSQLRTSLHSVGGCGCGPALAKSPRLVVPKGFPLSSAEPGGMGGIGGGELAGGGDETGGGEAAEGDDAGAGDSAAADGVAAGGDEIPLCCCGIWQHSRLTPSAVGQQSPARSKEAQAAFAEHEDDAVAEAVRANSIEMRARDPGAMPIHGTRALSRDLARGDAFSQRQDAPATDTHTRTRDPHPTGRHTVTPRKVRTPRGPNSASTARRVALGAIRARAAARSVGR